MGLPEFNGDCLGSFLLHWPAKDRGDNMAPPPSSAPDFDRGERPSLSNVSGTAPHTALLGDLPPGERVLRKELCIALHPGRIVVGFQAAGGVLQVDREDSQQHSFGCSVQRARDVVVVEVVILIETPSLLENRRKVEGHEHPVQNRHRARGVPKGRGQQNQALCHVTNRTTAVRPLTQPVPLCVHFEAGVQPSRHPNQLKTKPLVGQFYFGTDLQVVDEDVVMNKHQILYPGILVLQNLPVVYLREAFLVFPDHLKSRPGKIRDLLERLHDEEGLRFFRGSLGAGDKQKRIRHWSGRGQLIRDAKGRGLSLATETRKLIEEYRDNLSRALKTCPVI